MEKTKRKLVLNKKTIADLENGRLSNVMGGTGGIWATIKAFTCRENCDPTNDPTCDPTNDPTCDGLSCNDTCGVSCYIKACATYGTGIPCTPCGLG